MVAIDRLTAGELRDRLPQLHPVYRQCFAAPPWSESPAELDDYPARLARHTGYPGAYGFVATDDGELVGAVYGWPAPPDLPDGSDFDRAVRNAITPDVAPLLVAPAAVVAELMVAPAHRRHGIARALLTRFVDAHPRAWLATHPEAPAVALYESLGWIRRAAYIVGDLPLVLYTSETTSPREAALPRESSCRADRPLSQTPVDRRPPSRRI
ncbi:GNAT family N-acetyltransferase [Actinoplanes bogorensis]|uniref:GNAT family N-acetyltransferase n=1 Tax=Paractinoplanes bogorensis TaxID=1610840 RepID=A0ABS5YUL6_9ACTN|nr:GNAT family N-acetyltransferase [Actinoplanes bogorensis]MBU2667115.1 GNAT family N-acetyltransferase [Actinoplanes bogorensis]